MREEAKRSKYHEFELTEAGYELRQRVTAGGIEKPVVCFTRGVLGQGRPENEDDVFTMTKMIDPQIDVPVKETNFEKANHYITLVVDSKELLLEQDFLMCEIGVFAKVFNGETEEEVIPEILYGYTYTTGYDYVPDKTFDLYRELTFNTVLSKAANITVTYDRSKVYMTQDQFLELTAQYEKIFGEQIKGIEAMLANLGDISEIQKSIENLKAAVEAIKDLSKERYEQLAKRIEGLEKSLAAYPQIYVSATAPEEWDAGDWWYEIAERQAIG